MVADVFCSALSHPFLIGRVPLLTQTTEKKSGTLLLSSLLDLG